MMTIMANDPRIARSDTSLIEQLVWQFDFLRSSIERYETGKIHEALRLATTLRVLCHDAGTSKSLLGQLNFKHEWRWLDTAQNGSDAPVMDWGFLGHALPAGYEQRYVARLGSDPATQRTVKFKTWWNATIFSAELDSFNRHDLVNFVANQDGGAHVDPRIDPSYHRLSRMGSLGHSAWGGPDLSSLAETPAFEGIRQIAYEVEETAHRQRPDLFPEPLGRETPDVPTLYVHAAYIKVIDDAPVAGEQDNADPGDTFDT